MKKSLILGIAAVILLTTVSSSIAFFTDSVAANSNVIVSGTLKIEQEEWVRAKDDNGNYTVQPYPKESQPLYPAVMPADSLDQVTRVKVAVGDASVDMPDDSFRGYMDKIVTVKNNGTLPVYVRTFIAVPATSGTEWLHIDKNTGWEWTVIPGQKVANVSCNIYVATLTTPLQPGATTAPSLLGFYLDSGVNNKNGSYTFDGVAVAKDTLSIRVKTEATQADIFSDDAPIDNPQGIGRLFATDALDLVFGKVQPTDTDAAPHHPWQ